MAILKLNSTNVITESNNVATIDNNVQFPAGHVIQVKSKVITEVDSFNTSGFQDVSDFFIIIQPKLGNKILVHVEFRFGNSTSSNNGVQLLRNTDVIDLGGSNSTNLGNPAGMAPTAFVDTSFTVIDEPNTDQAITYKLQVQRSAGTLYINDRSGSGNPRIGTIYAMEIAS